MWFAIKGIPPCYRDEHMNKITNGRDLFRTLSEDILNSELTDEQVALLTLEFHRMLTEETEKISNSISRKKKLVKSERAHTKAELAILASIGVLDTYKKSVIKIKKAEHNLLESYFNDLMITHSKISDTDNKIYEGYYNNEELKRRENLGDTQGSNALRKLREILRESK